MRPLFLRRWRYLGYAALVLLVVVVVLVAGSWLAVRAWGPEFARERLEAALTTALGRDVSVNAVAVRPWLGRVVVTGVTASARSGEPGPYLFTLGRLEVNLGVSSLWRRRVVLRSVQLDGLDLRVSADGGAGSVRELPLLPEVVRAGPLEIELGAIGLREGRLLYADAGHRLRLQADGVTASVQPGRGTMSVTLGARHLGLDARQLRERIDHLEAEMRMGPTRIQASRVAGTWAGRRITVTGHLEGPFDEPTLALTASGEVDVAAVGQRVGSAWPVSGLARVHTRIEGSPSAPRVTASITSDALTAGPVPVRAVAARVALADGRVSVSELSLRAFDGGVTGSLGFALARLDDIQVTARLRNVSSVALERLAGLDTGIAARLDGAVDARGDLRDPVRLQGQGRIAAREVRLPAGFATLGEGTVEAELTGAGGRFDLARGIASWPGLRLEARGQATLEGPAPIRISGSADLARLGPALGQPSVSGEATLQGELSGHWRDNPTLAGRLEVRSPALAGLRVDQVAAPFELTLRSLRLTAASARLGQASVIASGSLTWPPMRRPALPAPGVVTLDMLARTEHARLQDLAPWLPTPLRGEGPVAVTARIDGTLAAWRVVGQAESSRLALPSVPPIHEARASFEATPDRLEVPTVRATILDAPLTARGRWRWTGRGEIEGDGGPVDLASVPGLPDGLRVQGRAHATVSATIRDGRVAGSGRIVSEGTAVFGLPLGRGVVEVTSDGATLRGEATFPEARIAASAQGRLDGGATIATRVSATDVEIEPLLRQLRPDLAGTARGRFSVLATLEVPSRDPRATRGLIRLEPVMLEAAGERWEARGPILLRREPGQLVVERLELGGRLGTATATGSLLDSGALDGTLRGQAPLALAAVLRPEIREASGRMDVDVRIGGTTAKPVLLGRGTITGGLIALRDTPVVIRDLQATVVLAPGRARIEKLQCSIGPGTVQATGEIGLEGGAIGAYQIPLSGRNLSFTAIEGLETAWNVDVTLVGRGPRGVVRGEARLVRGTYTRDLSILPVLLRGRSQEQPLEWGREIGLQIDVRLHDNLVVRSPQARLRAGGSLVLHGTVAQPALLGTIETQDGRITFRRNRYRLENAVVRFDDPRRLNPYLDVRATTRIRTYDITMRLSGRADDLTIRLSSEPPLPQEDLLALVTLGATRAELETSGGLTFAGEAAQVVSRELLGLEATTPFVDILEFGRDDAGQNQFRVGKRLDDRTTVIYSGSFAEGGQQKLRVEYQLLGPLLLAGEQVFTGGFGGDVILRLRFR
jgi:translocation and assembly module TamB